MERDPLAWAAWARVFSPLLDEALRKEAWEQLDLPVPFAASQPAFWKAFHVGMPQPPAPLLVHALLGADGGVVREEIVRVLEFLELDWSEHRLQPDHLACILELLAVAISNEDAVLEAGLEKRYLVPWVERALAIVEHEVAMKSLLWRLRGDLTGCI